MSEIGWRNTGLIIFSGLAILILSLILYLSGESTILLTFVSVLAPIVAFLVGIIGLNAFGRESLVKDDRFHAMNVWMALGLIVFSLSETAGVIIHYTESTNQICFTVGLVQMPALLLWGLGVLGYLRASNLALGVTYTERLLPLIIIISSIVGLTIIVVVTLFNPAQYLLFTIISVPMVVGLGLILFTLGTLLWTLRNGLIARPLTLLFLGIVLFFVRSIFWSFVNYCPGTPFDYVTGLESYILVGSSLIAASKLDEVYDTIEEFEE
ncbi:MAG: hypothetical protein ACFFEE_10535 [Candidatus Thorarchaeota archaeon]